MRAWEYSEWVENDARLKAESAVGRAHAGLQDFGLIPHPGRTCVRRPRGHKKSEQPKPSPAYEVTSKRR